MAQKIGEIFQFSAHPTAYHIRSSAGTRHTSTRAQILMWTDWWPSRGISLFLSPTSIHTLFTESVEIDNPGQLWDTRLFGPTFSRSALGQSHLLEISRGVDGDCFNNCDYPSKEEIRMSDSQGLRGLSRKDVTAPLAIFTWNSTFEAFLAGNQLYDS